MQLLAEVDPELAAPADRVRPLGGGRWELKAAIDDECRRGLERLKGLLSHVDPHMTMGQLMARLVQEGLDRHDPARPPRGRRTSARAAGAEQTSAPKTQAASTRGATSAAPPAASSNGAAPSAAKVSAQAPAQPGDEAADRPDTSAVKPAGTTISTAKTRGLGRQPATACAKPAAPQQQLQTSAAKAGGRAGRAIPAAVNARSGSATGAAAATWTAPAGAAATRNTCCRSITSCRTPRAAPPSRTISDCCAPRITATAMKAPDSAAPARTVRRQSAIQSMSAG